MTITRDYDRISALHRDACQNGIEHQCFSAVDISLLLFNSHFQRQPLQNTINTDYSNLIMNWLLSTELAIRKLLNTAMLPMFIWVFSHPRLIISGNKSWNLAPMPNPLQGRLRVPMSNPFPPSYHQKGWKYAYATQQLVTLTNIANHRPSQAPDKTVLSLHSTQASSTRKMISTSKVISDHGYANILDHPHACSQWCDPEAVVPHNDRQRRSSPRHLS